MEKINKSKRHIRRAFLTLLSSMPFDQISVKDIIETADIGRSTFYFYYNSKYDLAEEIENELIEGFTAIMCQLRQAGRTVYYQQITENHNDFFVEYFRFVKKNARAFKAFLSPQCTTGFSVRFTKAITKTRLQTIQIWNQNTGNSSSCGGEAKCYREEVLSSLYVTLFTSWLNRNMDLSEEEMAGILAAIWNPLTSI